MNDMVTKVSKAHQIEVDLCAETFTIEKACMNFSLNIGPSLDAKFIQLF